MSVNNEELGTLSRESNYLQGRLERLIGHRAQTVWNMLTLPERLAEWLAQGTIEPRLGGAVKLSFSDSGTMIDSTVTAFNEQRLMEYSWSVPGQPLRPVRWEVQAVGGVTRLILLVSVPQDEDIARTCAGWEAHLMMLLAAIDSVPIQFPFECFKRARDSYIAKVELLN